MYSHSPLLQSIVDHAAATPDKVALIANDVPVSYRQLLTNIRKMASLLQSMGVTSGERVILSARKEVAYVYVYFASHLLGASNVIVDAEASADRLRFIEGAVKPSWCIGYTSPIIKSVQLSDLRFEEQPLWARTTPGLSQDDTAEILFTTGTTGAPKGVCLSHFNIFSSASNINTFIGNGAKDVEVLGLPICHSFGLGRLRCNLLAGATIVLLGNFANVRAFFGAIEKYYATGFGMVPAVWAYIRKISGTRIAKYASQIKYIEIGSAAMPLESKKELCRLFPTTRICHHYGLTEASRATFMEYHTSSDLHTIGREVCSKVSVKIFDEYGVEVPNGEPGEICVRGNMVLRQYLLPEDNGQAFWDDYFRTGDSGRRDDNGNLYLVSRLKEMINVGGKKVSPLEVEEAALALGGIEDCAAIGMPDPKGMMGEVVKLFVQQVNCTRTLEEIAAFMREKLPVYAQPVSYEWIDVIPKTSSGKKQRLQLKVK